MKPKFIPPRTEDLSIPSFTQLFRKNAWMSLEEMIRVFQVQAPQVVEALVQAMGEGEIDLDSCTRSVRSKKGGKTVQYDLSAIIAVGFRVSQAFRTWSTTQLKPHFSKEFGADIARAKGRNLPRRLA